LYTIAFFSWPNFHELRWLSTQEKGKTMHDVQDTTDKYKHDKQFGVTTVTTASNLYEGGVTIFSILETY
jgi:hypothetical protein